MLSILFFFLITLTASAGWTSTYYVDKNHSNANDTNSGSETNPFLTIQKAADIAKAGDTVYVKEGIYKEWIKVENSGSSGNPIIFKAYSNSTPVIDGNGIAVPSGLALFYADDKNYITIDGFEIQNSNEYLIKFARGNSFTIRNCAVHDNSSNRNSGILVTLSDYSLIENNEVYNTGWNAINVTSCNHTMIRNNYIHDNSLHAGINIFPKTSEEQIMYAGNDVMFNYITGTTGAIYMRYQENNKIVGNVCFKNNYGMKFDKHSSGASSYEANTKIYNNTVVYNDNNGLHNISATDLIIKNNIFAYNNTYQLYIPEDRISGHTIDYNLYYSSNAVKLGWNGSTYDSLEAFKTASSQESHGLEKKPYFNNISANDYSITENSFAIDSGMDLTNESAEIQLDINGTARPKGKKFDIGAYEYISNIASLLAPKNLIIVN
jgi:parallel beta-helix repeat protein